ncbi:hypothetical protein OH76DRAFT_331941 [Lentinus brumalis]|uniref:Uncharacterized protein n=1 Tax=Lentinus brumalis TaxID=2498619 RepID=A0A371DFS8_9APHY|nr:hypothetical protein OH76DRAFT_331941 [Polyporus brumalis]
MTLPLFCDYAAHCLGTADMGWYFGIPCSGVFPGRMRLRRSPLQTRPRRARSSTRLSEVHVPRFLPRRRSGPPGVVRVLPFISTAPLLVLLSLLYHSLFLLTLAV